MSAPPRRHDLDWLRIVAVLLLVPFHSALIFALSPVHMVYIKDRVQSDALIEFAKFLYIWHMPLLFVIAGSATWFALRRRTAGEYIRERALRLLLPLGFALLTLIPLMTYLHHVGSLRAPTLLEHYGTFFTVDFDDIGGLRGHFTPAHLWFILFLFCFSAIALPLFLWLRRETSAAARRAIASVLGRVPALLLVTVPLALLPLLPGLADKNPFYFLGLFVLGFLIVSDEKITSAIDRALPWTLLAAVAGTAIYVAPDFGARFPAANTPAYTLYQFGFEAARWTSVLALIAIAHRLFNREGAALRYLNEAAYPFYILHLPVNTLVGYIVVRLDAAIPVKYVLINVFTIALTLAIYDLLVKRWPLTRLLFGMKPDAHAPVPGPHAPRPKHA